MQIFMLVQREGIRGPVPRLTALLIGSLGDLGVSVETHSWGRKSDREGLARKIQRGLEDVLSVRRTVRGAEFDVAVIQTAHDWRTVLRDLAVALVLRRHRNPVILQFHGSRTSSLVRPGSRVFKIVTALLLRMTDGVLVLSSEERRDLLAFRPATRVFVVKNPYARVPLPPKPPERTSDVPVLLFVGRLLEEKGALDLVEAMPLVLGRSPCELVLVGDGELRGALADRVRTLGLTNSVRMAGYLEGEELVGAYRAADVFVLPSWSEGFPTVLAEAMDAGLPIVTTRIRGAVDHLVDGEHALFVEARDVNGLATAIVELVRDPERRACMGLANQKRIDVFHPDVVAREYLGVLRLLVPGATSSNSVTSRARVERQ